MNEPRRTSGKYVVPVVLVAVGCAGLAIFLAIRSQRPELVDRPAPTETADPSPSRAADAPQAPPSVDGTAGSKRGAVAPSVEEGGANTTASAAADTPAEDRPGLGEGPPADRSAGSDEGAAAAAIAPGAGAPRAPRGVLSKEAIMAGIAAVKPQLRECFHSHLEKDPGLAGRVVISFTIEAKDGRGVVQRGEVKEEDTFSPVFEACVLKQVASAEFDAPEGEDGVVNVSYPFHFDPGGGFGGEPPPGDE